MFSVENGRIQCIIELDDGKIYRKTLYLMVKTMVSCKFSLKPIQWMYNVLFKINILFARFPNLSYIETHGCVATVSVARTCDNIQQWLERFHTYTGFLGFHVWHYILRWEFKESVFRQGNGKNRDTLLKKPNSSAHGLMHNHWFAFEICA